MASPNMEKIFSQIKGSVAAIEELTDELERHRESSEEYSERLLCLTWTLVGLTGVLAVLTLVLILQGFGVF